MALACKAIWLFLRFWTPPDSLRHTRSQPLLQLGRHQREQLPGAVCVRGPCCAGLDFTTREGKRGSPGARELAARPPQCNAGPSEPTCQDASSVPLPASPRPLDAARPGLSHYGCNCFACVLSRVRLFVILWTMAHHCGPLSLGFPGQEYWSGLPFPSPGDLPDQGLNRCLLHWQADSFITSPSGKSWVQLLEVAHGAGCTVGRPAGSLPWPDIHI